MYMRRSKDSLRIPLAVIGMLILILDSKLVLDAAIAGVELCIWTVIPSLFPFFVLCSMINSNIGRKANGMFRRFGNIFNIPIGSENILLTGFLGGYPIGAQSIMYAYTSGSLSKSDASRLLSFCNNVGPAFIFGIVSQQFESASVGWYLWLIVILSAAFVAMCIPGTGGTCQIPPAKPISVSQLIANAIKAIANVCAWVILFRIILNFLQKRVLINCHPILQIVLLGILELTNGIVQTASISAPQIRFILCAVFLNAGGMCVAMQTHSIAGALGMRSYYIGKVLQTVFSLLLSFILIPIVFKEGSIFIAVISFSVIILLLTFAQISKKSIAFSSKVLYDIKN